MVQNIRNECTSTTKDVTVSIYLFKSHQATEKVILVVFFIYIYIDGEAALLQRSIPPCWITDLNSCMIFCCILKTQPAAIEKGGVVDQEECLGMKLFLRWLVCRWESELWIWCSRDWKPECRSTRWCDICPCRVKKCYSIERWTSLRSLSVITRGVY